MTSYQNTNAVADSTQEAVKVRYTAKTHTSGGRRGGVSRVDALATRIASFDKQSIMDTQRLVNVAS
jgi:chorismate synthase